MRWAGIWIALSGLLMLVGCQDKGLTVLIQPPIVTIVEPVYDASFYEGESVLFKALVAGGDVDSDLTLFTHQWSADSTTACESAAVNADGSATCSIAFDDPGFHVVQVTVIDDARQTAVATVRVDILVNTPPVIEILEPETDDVFAPGDLIVFEASVSDAEDDPDDLVVTFNSSRDGDLTVSSSPDSAGAFSFALDSLSSGSHLITLKVTDTASQVGSDTVTIDVNGRPGPPTVSITPDPTVSGQSREAIIDTPSVDPEGDSVQYRYDWYRDAVLYSSGTNAKVPAGLTIRDEYWEVYVYPYDVSPTLPGDPGLATITILNSAPRITSVAITPSPADTTNDLLCNAGGYFDQDGDTAAYTYTWRLNGTADSAETADTYPAEKTTRGDLMQCQMTPFDAFDTGIAVLSGTLAIDNSLPTAPVVAITPSSPEPDDDLYCEILTDSSDADPSDIVSYSYAWYQNGTLTSETTNLVADSTTVDGDTWQCIVTPNDGTDDGPTDTDVVAISDTEAPDAPVIDTPYAYRNEDEVDLTGLCESGCALLFYCSDSSVSWTEADTCEVDGTFETTISLSRGEVTECYATCEDAAGNISGNSNTVDTEVCDPSDDYEDSAGYGNTGADAIDEWSTLSDDGATTILIEANILGDDTEDWYLISTSDSVSDDVSAGMDYYNFFVELTEGSSDYEILVHKGNYDPSDQECTTSSGYTEYNDKVEDVTHTGLTDPRECSSGNALGYNNCEDMSNDYYIQVLRNTSVSESCQHYELTITNGK